MGRPAPVRVLTTTVRPVATPPALMTREGLDPVGDRRGCVSFGMPASGKRAAETPSTGSGLTMTVGVTMASTAATIEPAYGVASATKPHTAIKDRSRRPPTPWKPGKPTGPCVPAPAYAGAIVVNRLNRSRP
jgi:hypothetical protein